MEMRTNIRIREGIVGAILILLMLFLWQFA